MAFFLGFHSPAQAFAFSLSYLEALFLPVSFSEYHFSERSPLRILLPLSVSGRLNSRNTQLSSQFTCILSLIA